MRPEKFYFGVNVLLLLVLTLVTGSPAQYVGEIDTVGTTWYPMQHNGSCGRMIRLDSNGNIHIV